MERFWRRTMAVPSGPSGVRGRVVVADGRYDESVSIADLVRNHHYGRAHTDDSKFALLSTRLGRRARSRRRTTRSLLAGARTRAPYRLLQHRANPGGWRIAGRAVGLGLHGG